MSHNTPKVSVIIPVYNTEKYLRECLDSVVNQTLRDIEIICVDDGSTDRSLEILREYEAKDPRVRAFTQQNVNAGAARNKGLENAKGEYLSFLDADDFFELNMLEEAYRRAKEKTAEIVVFRCDLFYSETGKYTDASWSVRPEDFPAHDPFAGIEVKKDFFKAFIGWAWDKLVMRSFVLENNIRFQEQRTTNDLYFTFFALAKTKRISFLDIIFAHHRKTAAESLSSTRERSWDCFYNALVMLYDALQSAGLYPHFEQDFINYCVHFSLWHVNSFTWPTQEIVFTMLKTKWAKDFHITEHDESYFYNVKEYQKFCSILNMQYTEVYPNGRPSVQKNERFSQLHSDFTGIQNNASYKKPRHNLAAHKDSQRDLYYEGSENSLYDTGCSENSNRDKKVTVCPKVSVVMPSLNVAPYIRECMESVINQTLKEIEIICVDAGSTDGTLEVLEEYAAKDDRITILHSDKKSYGYQMNIGIAAAQGEFVGIVETDDYISHRMYSRLYPLAKAHNLDFIKADYTRFIDVDRNRQFTPGNIAERSQYRVVLNPSATIDFFVSGKSIYSWAGIYRTAFLRDYQILHNETPGASFQDNGFWFQVFTQAHRAMFIDEAFYFLRRDNMNSSFNSKGKTYCACDEYDFIRSFLRSHPDLEKKFANVCALRRMHNYDFTLRRIYNEDKLQFLYRYSEDFNKILENGELERSLYSKKQWEWLHDVITCPEYIYYCYYYKQGRSPETMDYQTKTCEELRQEIENIHSSWSYRIGRFITFIPRKIRGGICCYREHGWSYTVERFLIHLKLRKEKQDKP